jgi:LacI family transcriptional regulator
MHRLGYVPNAAARSLVTHRTNLIGLVVSNITNEFYPEVIDAITKTALTEGYAVVLGNAGEQSSSQAAYLRLLAEQRVDGVILTSTLMGDASDITALANTGLAIVLANRVPGNLAVDSVALDNIAAGRTATAHLIEHGRRTIAYVGGRTDAQTNHDRFSGYRAALRSARLPFDERLVVHGEFSRSSGRALTRALLEAAPLDAIVAGDDTVALGCLDAVAEAGINIPGQLGLVGFDNIPAASIVGVGLTTIDSAPNQMGTQAVRLLLDRITGRNLGRPRRITLPATLVLRDSCGRHSAEE